MKYHRLRAYLKWLRAPPNSYVYFWNPTSQAWEGGIKAPLAADAGGPLQSNYVVQARRLLPGVCHSTEDIEVTITGEVPADDPRSNHQLAAPLAPWAALSRGLRSAKTICERPPIPIYF